MNRKPSLLTFKSKICSAKVMALIAAVICLGCILAQAQTPPIFNVKNYGAPGNGSTDDTTAINNAITAANQAGGGTVEFPSGNYLSRSIHLKSEVTLFLDSGATILAASSG